MKGGAELRFASDIPDYVRWTLSHMRRHPAFEWSAQSPQDWRDRPADWPATRYERKALDAGRIPSYLSFQTSIVNGVWTCEAWPNRYDARRMRHILA